MEHCNHDLAALKDNLCADCIVERLYGHAIKSVREIMFGGPLNVWERGQ